MRRQKAHLVYLFSVIVSVAYINYKCTLENKLKINDTYGVWKSLEQITGYKIKSQVISDDITLPDEVNAFYSHFKNTVEGQAGQPMMPS